MIDFYVVGFLLLKVHSIIVSILEVTMGSKYAKALVAANLVVPVGAAIAADHQNRVEAVCTADPTVNIDFQVRNVLGPVNGNVRLQAGNWVSDTDTVRVDYTAPRDRYSNLGPGTKPGEQHIYTHTQELGGGGKVQRTFVDGRDAVEEKTLDQFARASGALISEGRQVAQQVCQGDRGGVRKPIDVGNDPRAQWLQRRIIETVFSIQ